MEFARCTQNDLIYNAQQFAGLRTDDLSQKRRYLVCPECGGHAFFRTETRNEREACFGARPHADGCHFRAAQAATNARDYAEAHGHPAHRLVVDFGYGGPAQWNRPIHPGDVENLRAQDEPVAGSGFNCNQVQHVRLRPLLRLLTAPTAFRTSRQIVDVAGFGTFAVADFFISFDATTPMHSFKLNGFFGQLVSAQFDHANTLWLNSGGHANLSICVPGQHVADLFNRFGISDKEQLTGTRVLVFGVMQISQTGKRYVVLEDLNHITIDFAPG